MLAVLAENHVPLELREFSGNSTVAAGIFIVPSAGVTEATLQVGGAV